MAKSRHDHLAKTLETFLTRGVKNINYLEVGTFDGARTEQLCKLWLARTGKKGFFNYTGFDLFEGMTKDYSAAELSKSTLPPTMKFVADRLTAAGATVSLIQGNTRETIPQFVEAMRYDYVPDLIFIDGGHSLETVASDWSALKDLMVSHTTVLFDDYYENKEGFGCQSLITTLQQENGYTVQLLDPVDVIPNSGLRIRMVAVRLKG